MKCDVTKFLFHLSIKRSCAASTIHDYSKELTRLESFFTSQKVSDLKLVTISLLREYLYFLKDTRNLSQTSISKVIAIIKSFLITWRRKIL